MYLWILILVLWVLASCMFLINHPMGSVLFSGPAFLLTGFAIIRGVLRWVGRQFRGDYKRG